MFNFFIIMDENLGNTIARHFSSKYLNYTINFIISKEFPSFSDFPDFSLVLCDLDQNIELAKKYNVDMPIVEAVNEVLFDNKPAEEAMWELMEREQTNEFHDLEWR